MNYILKHDELEICINSKGAEQEHLIFKGKDYMRIRDEYWNRKAPILFPIVGKLKDLKTFIDSKEYHMNQHGFARDMEFELFEKKNDELVFKVTSNEDSLKIYPYKFDLKISYKIEGRKVTVTYTVLNIDDKEIYFNIGGHPGLRMPMYEGEKFDDYKVEFEKAEDFDAPTVDLTYGTLNFIDTIPYHNISKIDLNYKYFEIDAIVIPNIKSKYVKLVNKNDKGVLFEYNNFNTLAIWTRPNAPFVCLEPWKGYADHTDSNYDFKSKDDIVKLDVNKEISFSYAITILD